MATSFVEGVVTDPEAIYPLPMPYLRRNNIEFRINNVSVPYIWVTSQSIQPADSPSNGDEFLIRRVTPDIPIVNFADASPLIAKDLNLPTLQALYRAQEITDNAGVSAGEVLDDIVGFRIETEDFRDEAEVFRDQAREAAENVTAPYVSYTDDQPDFDNRVDARSFYSRGRWNDGDFIAPQVQLADDEGQVYGRVAGTSGGQVVLELVEQLSGFILEYFARLRLLHNGGAGRFEFDFQNGNSGEPLVAVEAGKLLVGDNEVYHADNPPPNASAFVPPSRFVGTVAAGDVVNYFDPDRRTSQGAGGTGERMYCFTVSQSGSIRIKMLHGRYDGSGLSRINVLVNGELEHTYDAQFVNDDFEYDLDVSVNDHVEIYQRGLNNATALYTEDLEICSSSGELWVWPFTAVFPTS